MQRKQGYPALPDKARCTVRAVKDGRRIAIRGASLDDVIRQLRERCPNGRIRDLWEVEA